MIKNLYLHKIPIELSMSTMKTKDLINLCKERKIKGYSGKKKAELIIMLEKNKNEVVKSTQINLCTKPIEINTIILGNCLEQQQFPVF